MVVYMRSINHNIFILLIRLYPLDNVDQIPAVIKQIEAWLFFAGYLITSGFEHCLDGRQPYSDTPLTLCSFDKLDAFLLELFSKG
jgi:hypothetical protein